MQRKCTKCGHWNEAEDHCVQCGAALSLKEIEAVRQVKHLKKEQFRKPNRFDLFLERMAQNKNPLIKIIYYILYSTWVVLMSIVAGILYLVAGTPG